MEIVSPTRMTLLLKREEVKTASVGAELLRNKRDVLLAEFFSTLKPLLALRERLDEQADAATAALIFALGLEGKEKLNSLSFVASSTVNFQINYKNLLGLKIPEVITEYQDVKSKDISVRIDTGLTVKETQDSFYDFLKLALRILPQELKLKRLGLEIKNTTRKVNSLEKYVIPQLYSQVKFIREALEEREREDIFRLKRLKKRLTR